MRRPTSISIIGWLLIVFGVLAFISVLINPFILAHDPKVAALMAHSQASQTVIETVGLIGAIVDVAAGTMLLRRVAAGRLLYVIWGAFTLAFSLWSSPVKGTLIGAAVIYGLIVFFLFRRPAGDWLGPDAHR